MRVRVLRPEHIGGAFRQIGEVINLRAEFDAEKLELEGLIEILDKSAERDLAKGGPRSLTLQETKSEKVEPVKKVEPAKPVKRQPAKPLLDPPDVWITMPTYNRKDEILKQLESIKPQVLSIGASVVVINDGSTDGTREALDSFNADWLHAIHLNQNRGVAYARRIGAGFIPDDAMVIEIDDHDELFEDILEKIQETFRDPDVQFVYGDCRVIDERGKVDNITQKPDYRPGLFREDCYAIGVRAYRKKLYNDIGGYRSDEFPGEDYALFLRMELFLSDKGFVRIPDPLCTVKMIGNGVSVRQCSELASNAEKYKRWAIRRAAERDSKQPLNLDFGYRMPATKTKKPTEIALIMPVSDKKKITMLAIDSIMRHTTKPRFIFIADKSLSFKDDLRERGTLILTEGAFSFSRAVNLGIKAAGQRDVVVLNNDIEVAEGWLNKLTNTPYGASMSRTDMLCCGNRDAWCVGDVQETKAPLIMFCVYLSRDVIRKVGLLDERYIYYGGEDTDYSIRLMRHRIPMWVSEAFVKHTPTSSFGSQATLDKTMAILKNKWGVEHEDISKHYKKSLVSVIMAGRNAEKWADKSIETIVNQTHKDLEIIIIDDASEDDTPNICERWAAKDDRIIFIRNSKRLGGKNNRNVAFKYARGEFIAVQDLDDFSQLDRIETLLIGVDKDPSVDLIYSDFDFVNTEDAIIEKRFVTGKYSRQRLLFGGDYVIAFGTFLMRRHLFETVGLWSPLYNHCEETAWLLDAEHCGIKMHYLDKPLYSYRRHDSNNAGTKESFNTLVYLREREKLRERHIENYPH